MVSNQSFNPFFEICKLFRVFLSPLRNNFVLQGSTFPGSFLTGKQKLTSCKVCLFIKDRRDKVLQVREEWFLIQLNTFAIWGILIISIKSVISWENACITVPGRKSFFVCEGQEVCSFGLVLDRSNAKPCAVTIRCLPSSLRNRDHHHTVSSDLKIRWVESVIPEYHCCLALTNRSCPC